MERLGDLVHPQRAVRLGVDHRDDPSGQIALVRFGRIAEGEDQQIDQRAQPRLLMRPVAPVDRHDLLEIAPNLGSGARRQPRGQAQGARIVRPVAALAGNVYAERARPRLAGQAGVVMMPRREQQHVVALERVFRLAFGDRPRALTQIDEIVMRQHAVEIERLRRLLVIVRSRRRHAPRLRQIKADGHNLSPCRFIHDSLFKAPWTRA